MIRPFRVAAAYVLGLLTLSTSAVAQERNLPEEVRALAVVCSSGASVGFRGQIEGGINRLFSKVLEGEGELEISKNETDFLNSFNDEKLKIEARAVYNECVLGALQIVYNLKREKTLGSSDSRLLVPDSLARIQPGERFALRVGDAIGLVEGGIVAIPSALANCGRPSVQISNSAARVLHGLNVSDVIRIPKRDSCWITLYGMRPFGDDETCVYSLLYECK